MKLPEALRTRYMELAPREQKLVLIGGVFAVLLILYLAVIQPLAAMHARLEQEILYDKASLALILDAKVRIRESGNSGGNIGRLPPGQSLLAAISSAAQRGPIASGVQRIEQAGDGGVRLTLSSVPFDDLVRWLATLSQRDGVDVSDASIQQATSPGTVNATLTLKSAS